MQICNVIMHALTTTKLIREALQTIDKATTHVADVTKRTLTPTQTIFKALNLLLPVSMTMLARLPHMLTVSLSAAEITKQTVFIVLSTHSIAKQMLDDSMRTLRVAKTMLSLTKLMRVEAKPIC